MAVQIICEHGEVSYISDDNYIVQIIHEARVVYFRWQLCCAVFTWSFVYITDEVPQKYCYQQPCRNNGVCVEEDNGYTCQCPFLFNGTNCENDLSKPLYSICKHLYFESLQGLISYSIIGKVNSLIPSLTY